MPERMSFDRSVFWSPDGPVERELECALRAAAPGVMVYAERQAWIYFQDEGMAAAILEAALDAVSRRLMGKSGIPPMSAVQLTLRDEVRRFAKRASRNRRVEAPQGNLFDLESLAALAPPNYEQTVFVNRLLELLNPSARHIAKMLAAGYSWREIGVELDVDYSGARRAFRSEVDKALKTMHVSRAGFKQAPKSSGVREVFVAALPAR